MTSHKLKIVEVKHINEIPSKYAYLALRDSRPIGNNVEIYIQRTGQVPRIAYHLEPHYWMQLPAKAGENS